MKFNTTPLAGVYVIDLEPHSDFRGSFVRTFCKKEFASIGSNIDFVQINQSFNLAMGTFRGMHFQRAPFVETKLVRCISGSVLDIVVDLREDSPTYLKNYTVTLSKENQKMIYIPKGFAHGFLTLEDNTSLIYHHTEYYHPESEFGIRYDDPKLGLLIPHPVTVISPRDATYPLLP